MAKVHELPAANEPNAPKYDTSWQQRPLDHCDTTRSLFTSDLTISTTRYPCAGAATDAFHDMPAEIVCQVLSMVGTADLLATWMQLSKAWRARLPQFGALWSDIRADKEQFSPKALLSVAHHIERLEILDHPHRWLASLYDEIERGVFTRLQHLKINLPFDHSINLLRGLTILGHTLTTLNISLRDPALYLASAINACPNLVCLEFNSPFWYHNLEDLATNTGKLRILKLDNYCARQFTRDEITTVLSRLGRELRVLSMPMRDHDIDVVEQHCPRLHTLTCGAYIIVPAHNDAMQTVSTTEDSCGAGLRCLTTAPQDMQLFFRMLQRHAATLETLHLWLYFQPRGSLFTNAAWTHDLQLHRLRSLSIVTLPGSTPDMSDVVGALLDICQPSLQHFYLQGGNCIPSVSLPCMQRLTCLRLGYIKHVDAMSHYFQQLVAMGDACSVRTIELHNIDVSDHDLALLSKIRTLRNIKFVFCPGGHSCTVDALTRFFINTLSPLRTVGLVMPRFTAAILDALGEIPSVKKLVLVQKPPAKIMHHFKTAHPKIRVFTLDKDQYHRCCCSI